MNGDITMNEEKYDQSLWIKTTGLREWKGMESEYNRYEATPYIALDHLFQSYKLTEGDHLIDFGSGRGRVSFYIHDRFHIPVTGIEANDTTFDEALSNQKSYLYYAKEEIEAPIQFDYGLAEGYEIEDSANRFYFFNPFSAEVFEQVVKNIMESLKRKARQADIILYYPLPQYKRILKKHTPFKLINKIKVPKIHGKYGKFLIYRFEQEEEQA